MWIRGTNIKRSSYPKKLTLRQCNKSLTWRNNLEVVYKLYFACTELSPLSLCHSQIAKVICKIEISPKQRVLLVRKEWKRAWADLPGSVGHCVPALPVESQPTRYCGVNFFIIIPPTRWAVLKSWQPTWVILWGSTAYRPTGLIQPVTL